MHRGIVRADSGLNLREKPNGKVHAVLPAKAEIEILEEVHFFRVKTAEGMTGYVHGDYIEELPSIGDVALADTGPIAFPSPSFQLVRYRGANFIGRDAMVDEDFAVLLKNVDRYAGDHGIKVWVTSSIRNINQQLQGAVVAPATRSCHYIGHAIDMNVQYDGRLYNSKQLRRKNLNNLPRSITAFIEAIREDDHLRWGGDFSEEDPVHIDDDFFHQQQMMYMAKLHSRMSQLNG